MEEKYCPTLNSFCINKKCAWWINPADCAIAIIARNGCKKRVANKKRKYTAKDVFAS